MAEGKRRGGLSGSGKQQSKGASNKPRPATGSSKPASSRPAPKPASSKPVQDAAAKGKSARAEPRIRPAPASIQSDAAALPTQRLGAGRRVRTPPPAPGEREKSGADAGQGQQRGLGRLANLLQNQGSPQAIGESPLTKKLKDKADQFQHIQEFLHSAAPLNLRRPEFRTSSTPEEIESRKAEVRYLLQLMQSMVAVLTDELEELDKARPSGHGDQAPSTAE